MIRRTLTVLIVALLPTSAFGATVMALNSILVPSNDPGRFNLQIDGVTRATAVGNGGTGAVTVSPGTHTAGVTGANGTILGAYTIAYGNDCSSVGATSVPLNQHRVCTVTLTRRPPVTHGSWTRGAGTYVFTACAYGTTCDLQGNAGQNVSVKLEVWSAGGGGGAGEHGTILGGRGGGGGGGGVYTSRIVTITIPASGISSLYVLAGTAGARGYVDPGVNQTVNGQPGGNSTIWTGSLYSGSVLISANGGGGGHSGVGPAYGYNDGVGGATGQAASTDWAGTAGYNGGVTSGCNGAAGGLGGAGGGPGRTGPGYFNDGGGGGHGGYHRNGWFSCNSASMDYALSNGSPGGDGRVVISW